MHRLLTRQVNKYLSLEDKERLKEFLEVVNQAYTDFDGDIKQIENILEQSSQELFRANKELQLVVDSRTEEARAASERLRLVVNNINEVIFQTDMEGCWNFLNPAWEKITGFSISESLGTSYVNYIHPEDQMVNLLKVNELVKRKVTSSFHIGRLITKDGNYKWVEAVARLALDDNGNILGITGTLQDITQRLQMEEERRKSEEKFRVMFENSSVAYLLIEDGRILECNPAALAMYSISHKKDFIGKYIFDFSPEKQPNGKSSFEEAFKMLQTAEEEGHHRFDWLHLRKNGSELPVEISLNYIPVMGPTIMFVVLHDLTERKVFEKELIRAKEAAESASVAKAQFLSTMSHEIRTPMNAIIGITHILLNSNPHKNQIKNLNTLKFSAENLLVLINDILDFSKIEAGKVEIEEMDFDLFELLNGISSSFKFKAQENGIEFITNIGESIPRFLVGDTTRLSQILTNLVSNAVKFTDQGSIFVNVQARKKTQKYIKLKFEVIDTGIGISKAKLITIFDSFSQASSTTTRIYGGTGLGLAITKRLLELMGSNIRVESILGQGTRFFFDLDLRISKKTRVYNQSSLFSRYRINRLKGISILLVEDNPINVMVLKQFFKKWEMNYEVAENGRLALEKVQVKDFDVILMDLQMPEMNGFEATRAIRKLKSNKYKKLPIIAITASAVIEIQTRVFNAGMNDYVTKPVNPNDLYRKIEKHMVLSP